tara:strand:+ start:1106 stop:1729 length:624 start_codon:yes stop_codon:yes gene_type:complete
MNIEIGQRVPMDIVWNTRVRDQEMADAGEENPYRWQSLTSGDLFKDRRIVLFALPGAFTPTCSAKQLPMYEQNYMAFKKAGVDDIYCLSVNDSFVMNAWFRYQNIKHVKPIPDGSGIFTEKLGMLVDKDNLSFGQRSWRYALLLNDGIVEKTFIEDGFGDNIGDDPFEVSDAETVFDYITNESPVDMPGRQLTLELFDGPGAKDKMS